MIARAMGCAQGQMSQWACGIPWAGGLLGGRTPESQKPRPSGAWTGHPRGKRLGLEWASPLDPSHPNDAAHKFLFFQEAKESYTGFLREENDGRTRRIPYQAKLARLI